MVHEHNGKPGEGRPGRRVLVTGERISVHDPHHRVESPRAWQLVGTFIGGLLLAIVLAGVLAINENQRVKEITERSLTFDIEVEDEGADVLVAILELRHIHRNILFSGVTDSSIADFEDAYAALLEELEEMDSLGLSALGLDQPARIRALAERYYADFRPAIEAARVDPEALLAASDIGLSRLAAMNAAASELDNFGDQLADDSLARVNDAVTTEQFFLSALVVGALLVGVALAISAARILARLRSLYEREQQSRGELARSLQTKTDFIADASHELRTPLAVILGNAETSLAGGDPQMHESSLAAIATEAKRMGKLVDDLLFLARSDAGTPPIEREFVPARWLVSRLVKPAKMLARQRDACLADDITGEGYLEVDPERIEQAVLILVDNAARHSPPGACVRLSSRVEGRHLAIDVVDTGSGIAPEELPLIFDRFYQVKNRRTRKWGGSGLGLSIARTIVAAHGGSIMAESRLGAGTTMTIRLPMAAAPEPVDEPATGRVQAASRAGR